MQARGMTLAAAATAYGIGPDTIRRRIRRGELLAYQDDYRRLLIAVNTGAGALPPGGPPDRQVAADVQALRARVQTLQAVLAEVRGERDLLRQQVGEHVHERERWHNRLSEAHHLIEDRRQARGRTTATLARRLPWSRWWAHLWRWWVRA